MSRLARASWLPAAAGVVGLLLTTAVPASDLPISGESVAGLADFDSQFSELLARYDIPGAQVAIMKGDEIVFSRGYGWADVEENQPVEPASLFRIAGVSTVFTAAAVLKLVEDGKLALDQRAFSVLDDLEPRKGQWRDLGLPYITVENVLQMTGGWDDKETRTGGLDPMFGNWPRLIPETLDGQFPASCALTARYKMGRPLQFKPGTHYAYSDFQYCVAGLIVNRANGDDYGPGAYEEYVRKSILGPAGITDMRLGETLLEDRAEGEVRYYPTPGENSSVTIYPELGTLPREYGGWFYLGAQYGNGAWIATASDLVTFAQALAHGKVIDEGSVERMLAKPAGVEYWEDKDSWFGMGWHVRQGPEGLTWFQKGRIPGTVSHLQRGPGDVAFAVLFNRDPDDRKFRREYPALLESAAAAVAGD